MGISIGLLPKRERGGGIKSGHTKELFKQICSIDNLFLAWHKFCRGKRSKMDVMQYERLLEYHLFELQVALHNGAYQHGPYVPFTLFDPKRRYIHKATVEDRIVHQAVVNVIEPLFDPRFIFDSYSCRVGKGTHAAVIRLRTFLRRASINNTRTVYILQCDIKKFFDSVDHRILFDLLKRQIRDDRVMRLFKKIINSFSTVPGKGLPLGNLTSQLFANVYLHELDWFVKHMLRETAYVRYCDDFVIVSRTREHLQSLITELNTFLQASLLLELHPKKVSIRTWKQGVDFLGYVTLPHCTVLRTKTKQRMIKRVNERNVSSYLGVCAHASAHETGLLLTCRGYCSSTTA